MKGFKSFSRRHFLVGAGGVSIALPLLESLPGLEGSANAQAAGAEPFVAMVVNGNGVVQAEANQFDKDKLDPEWFWPTELGPLTSASLTQDNAERTTGELASFADKLLMVRGLEHIHPAKGCMHASSDAQMLTAAVPLGKGNKTVGGGESLDNMIARELNPMGREPLTLHAGRYSAGGTGYNIPGYLSYRAAGQPRTPIASPLQAYETLVGLEDISDGQRAQRDSRRNSVNDALRAQLQGLMARPDLSVADRDRLQQHFDAIRELEVQVSSLTLPPATVEEMRRIDPEPYAEADHETVIRLQMDVMVLALSMGYSRVITLKVGDREDDHRFDIDGDKIHFHDASHLKYGARSRDLLRRIDRIHAGHYRYLLERLTEVTTPQGALIDQGVTIWTNQVANGAHRFTNLPYVLAGDAGGYFKTGRFVDMGGVPNGLLLNTLMGTVGLPERPFGDGVLDELLV